MNWDLLLTAFGLMLIFEGLFPFLNPKGWRRMFEQVLGMHDGQIRFFGIVSIAIGLVLIWLL
jgi:uncharacterized protein